MDNIVKCVLVILSCRLILSDVTARNCDDFSEWPDGKMLLLDVVLDKILKNMTITRTYRRVKKSIRATSQ